MSKKTKILLTGSTGMVGRNILDHKDISQYHLLTPSTNDINLLNFHEVKEYLKNQQPDIVIHAAGKVGGIQANMAQPVNFLVENLDMARNIILASRENKVLKLINLGSSCMYPREAQNPLKEEFILTGELEPTNEGYALAKILASKLCEYITQEDSNFNYKTIIPCNLYGKYDKFNPKNSHMLPAVIKKIHEAKLQKESEIEVWGDGTARREFMYAGDLADFVLYAITHFEEMPQNINVGLGKDYSILEYYKTIATVIGYDGVFNHNLSKPVGMKQKLVDNTQQIKFGWQANTSLVNGIKKTYEYYLKELTNEYV